MLELLSAVQTEPLLMLAVLCVIVTEGIKTTGLVKHGSAMLSIVVGAVMGVLVALTFQTGVPIGALTGVIAGGLASGMYDLVQPLVKNRK